MIVRNERKCVVTIVEISEENKAESVEGEHEPKENCRGKSSRIY